MMTSLDYKLVAKYLIYVGFNAEISDAFVVTRARDIFSKTSKNLVRSYVLGA